MSKKQGQRPAKDVLKDSFREIYGGKKKECQHSGAVDGKTNYALLCRLLASLGSKVLREVFDRKIPPQDLYIALKRESVYSKLLSLQKQEILSPEQWCKLYPVNPSSVLSTGFDPDLLIVLLRTICDLSPPATGWDIPPNPLDTSCESDIIRLKYFMNAVSTHAEKDSVSDTVFCEYKDEIQKTLVRLGGDEYKGAICEMEKQEMGPLDKEHFKGLLKQWKDGDDRINDKLNEWECIRKTSRDTGAGAVDGKTNYALLCRLLASLGSNVLREVFDRKIPPQDLYIALKRESVYSKLLSLQKQEILSPEQWSQLYPVNPSSVLSTGFDPDLLIVLLRTICNLSPPATGWDIPPNPLDTSCESDIVRLKYFMNAVSTHAEKESVSDAVFCEYKDEIQKTLVRLGGDEYKGAICEMEKQEMGPLDKEHFKGLLKQWKDGDDRIKDKLNKWECLMKNYRDSGAGNQPLSIRQERKIVAFSYPSISWLVPEFLYIPGWFIAAGTHKF
ncbi:uncharacterized protein [Montipora foliosa]|uniref:uncharacterized protein n=1 Tax=Montipora foliosa TaxID=591990 RepID=UPI0035F1B2CA